VKFNERKESFTGHGGLKNTYPFPQNEKENLNLPHEKTAAEFFFM